MGTKLASLRSPFLVFYHSTIYPPLVDLFPEKHQNCFCFKPTRSMNTMPLSSGHQLAPCSCARDTSWHRVFSKDLGLFDPTFGYGFFHEDLGFLF